MSVRGLEEEGGLVKWVDMDEADDRLTPTGGLFTAFCIGL